jgi:small subunit ribosomal protein S20
MPNTKSAERRVRANEAKRQHNAAVKTRLRTAERRLREAITGGQKDAASAALREACSALDKAAKSGVIPKARGSRKKSRLALLTASLK